MDIFLQQVVNGLTLGSIYAVVALGYTMVYGIIQLINFAHGEVVMVGAMVALATIATLAGSTALPPAVVVFAGVACAVPVCMVLGFVMERVAYRPLRGAPRLAPLITAIGLSIILQHVALLIWGRSPLSFPQIMENPIFEFAGAHISMVQIGIMLISVVMMVGLTLVVYHTRLGVAMRATSENPQIAGVMVGTYYGVAHYTMGSLLGLKAFSAAVLGGIGNLAGAMLGGILLGVVEALGAGYIGEFTDLCRYSWLADLLAERCAQNQHFVLFGSNYQDVFAFLVLIAVLIFRPSGLLGERVGDRA